MMEHEGEEDGSEPSGNAMATFNFATDVVDRWAADSDLLALIAVDDRGNERLWTFAQISERTHKVANLLLKLGIAQGDRILVMLPRIAEWQIAMTAALRIGAVPIPCITMLKPKDIEYRVEHSGAIGVITTTEECSKFAGLDRLAVKVTTGIAPHGWCSLEDASHMPAHCSAATVALEDPAILFYTSGSTGMPKGVTHAARALQAWAGSAIHWLGLSERDRIWCTADTGWSKAGTSILFGPWSQGASCLFYDGPFDPAVRLELLEKYDITVFCAAATELRRLVLEDFAGRDLSKLKATVSAGESVNPEIIHRWRELTGLTVLDGYGQTETLMTVTNRRDRPVKAGSMGLPLPGVTIGVRTENGEVARVNASGELLISSPNPQIMLGYWDDPQRTASQFETIDGQRWFMTGDTVEIDHEGYVFYNGRADDIINSSGYRIGPQEVENALVEHPAVQECAVAGIPDPERGEIVKAWVVLKPGQVGSEALLQDIQNHTKAVTASYKYPRAIEFVDTLPKTVSGKIRRGELRSRTSPG